MSDALTPLERKILRDLGQMWGEVCEVVGNGRSRIADLNEMVVHIHALQHFVMAQAAARAYPTELRLAGEVLP
jgi:hypothetical protein